MHVLMQALNSTGRKALRMKTKFLSSACVALAFVACGVEPLDIETIPNGVAGGAGAVQGGAAGAGTGGESTSGGAQSGGSTGLVAGGTAGMPEAGATQGGASGDASVAGGATGAAGGRPSGGAAGTVETGGASGSSGATGGASGSGGSTGGASGSGGSTGGASGSGGSTGGASGSGGSTGGASGVGGSMGGTGGNVSCVDGFTGDDCDQCASGYFGVDCEPCACVNGICDEGLGGDGGCSCSVGWDGDQCDVCSVGHFGPSCDACSCVNGQCDDGIDGAGTCACNTGWSGSSCTQCDTDFWGPECTLCQCDQGVCDDGSDGTGACSCEAGWAQPTCETCESDYYGPTCMACSCGGGTCDDGSTGDGTCYDCPPGFLGDACDECQANRYGADCDLCACVHGSCDEGITGDGSCGCQVGWDGPTCEVCATGYYGSQCTSCPAEPTAGCPCSTPSELACAGTAQKVQLMCEAGTWKFNASCSANQNCNTASGACATIVTGCSGQTGGYTFCEAPDIRHSCGVDLVTTTSVTCNGLCSQGDCVAPTCGDGKIQTTLSEECDDANQDPADNCEANCQRSEIVKITMGTAHSCALLESGHVRCWGGNEYNQLGQGDDLSYGTVHPYQIPVLDLGGVARDIDAGYFHTCAVLTDDTVRCWGANDSGQLGLGDANARLSHTPNAIGAISVGGGVSKIAVGGNISCALLKTGTVRCWGNNSNGALGLGSTTPISTTQTPGTYGPITVGGVVSDIAVGANHGCAVLSSNGTNTAVRCWGWNFYGQLGRQHSTSIGDTELPNATDPNIPAGYDATGLVPLASGKTPRTVAAGANLSCVIFTDGTMECWGQNNGGQLGLGHAVHIADGSGESPALNGIVAVGTGGISEFAGGGDFSCGYFGSGAIRCWGLNNQAELGQPNLTSLGNAVNTIPSLITPLSFGGGLSGAGVYAGTGHTCVLLDNGRARCWGYNHQGQLGMAYVSTSPTYVGGSSSLTPDLLPSLAMFTATR